MVTGQAFTGRAVIGRAVISRAVIGRAVNGRAGYFCHPSLSMDRDYQAEAWCPLVCLRPRNLQPEVMLTNYFSTTMPALYVSNILIIGHG